MCWFVLVRKMWGFLANSHATVTDNYNLSNKQYIYFEFIIQPGKYPDTS